MDSPALLNCKRLQENFEGREAVHIEKSVLRVRVSNIRWQVDARQIHAEVEEVPTAGLYLREPNAGDPLRWKIGAGYLTSFSSQTWSMGYGGWSLHFEPKIVSGLITLAAEWPNELKAADRYKAALRFLADAGAYQTSERVFPD